VTQTWQRHYNDILQKGRLLWRRFDTGQSGHPQLGDKWHTPYNPTIPIAFMHLPKTSGTSLTQGLVEALRPRSALLYHYDRALFGGFTSFSRLRSEIRETIHLDPSTLPDGPDFIAGHASLSSLNSRYGSWQHITFLREPISRTLSHWLFFRGLSQEIIETWKPFSDAFRFARGPLAEFLKSHELACQIDNVYVRMLLWPHPLIPNDNFIDDTDSDDVLLKEAVDRLTNFVYADVIENPLFVSGLEAWFGRNIPYPSLNKTPPIGPNGAPSLPEELSLETISLLSHRTRLDSVLWRMVATKRIPNVDPDILRAYVLSQNLLRYSSLVTDALWCAFGNKSGGPQSRIR
jgi:hypothetical protein